VTAARTMGIETVYRGIRFRSRAEARWAAFFDLCGWRWSYEPLDLAGYIPDFIIEPATNRYAERPWQWEVSPLLVEVKGSALRASDLSEHRAKIALSGWRHEAVVLPAALNILDDGCGLERTLVAMLGGPFETGEGWENEVTIGWCEGHEGVGLTSVYGGFYCRICGHYPGGSSLDEHAEQIRLIWAQACNTTRWK
jgi:hypothetical protein